MPLTKGEIVKVRLYGGAIELRRFLVEYKNTIVICAESEWQKAIAEEREPSGLGFPRECVITEEQNGN